VQRIAAQSAKSRNADAMLERHAGRPTGTAAPDLVSVDRVWMRRVVRLELSSLAENLARKKSILRTWHPSIVRIIGRF
jgi:hypothetical protein